MTCVQKIQDNCQGSVLGSQVFCTVRPTIKPSDTPYPNRWVERVGNSPIYNYSTGLNVYVISNFNRAVPMKYYIIQQAFKVNVESNAFVTLAQQKKDKEAKEDAEN